MPKQVPYDAAAHVVAPPPQFVGVMPDVIPSDTPLQFEQRVLWPSRYPVLDYRDKNGKGEIATHRMADGEVDIDGVRTPIAYPTVVYDAEKKKLIELKGEAALDHAMKTGEFRTFGTPEEAGAYAEGMYKRHWGQGDAMDAFVKMLQQGTK